MRIYNLFGVAIFCVMFKDMSLGSLNASNSSLLVISSCEKPVRQNNENIVILDLKKTYDTSASFWNEYSSKCKSWNLDKPAVLSILKYRKKIDNFKFHSDYDVLPCSYEGHILLNGIKYHIDINPGAYLVLSAGGKDYYYDCSNEHTKKYFISMPADS